MTEHSPFVYWGQDKKSISFRVDVKDAEIPTIELTEKSIRFKVSGIGSDGKKNYSFNFDFFEEVIPKVRISIKLFYIHIIKFNFFYSLL